MKELNDTNFDEMSYEHLKEIALRLIPHACFEKIYYCQTGAKLSLGVRELKSTQDIADMLKVSYDNENEIDLYIEHFGYDIMELAELERNEEQNHNSIGSSDEEYYDSDDCEEIENVDFMSMRNVEDGRCAGKKGNKYRVMKIKVRSGVQIGVRKKVVRKKVVKKKFFKEIIEDPFMSLRKMRDDIRQKFMIDVSLGKCRRAKQLALFDHEGGLIEHYGKLY
ncbi:hypothetical protein Tco_0999565 [Tanacetum coccineum]